MAFLREFVLNQSFLPSGATVREHIKNPRTLETATYICVGQLIELEVEKLVDLEVIPIRVDLDCD